MITKILASSLYKTQSIKVNRNSRRNTLINWTESLEKWQTIKGLGKVMQFWKIQGDPFLMSQAVKVKGI